MKSLGIKNVLTIGLFTATLFFSSCDKDSSCNCMKSAGNTVTESRTLAEFNILEIEKNVEVILVQDTVFYAKVTCGKNLMDGISTEVSDGRLTITNNNRCNWARSYKNRFVVEVHCTNLVKIIYSTSGNLTSLNRFKVDSLYLESDIGSGSIMLNLDANVFYGVLNTGVADLTVSGKAGATYFLTNGQGFIDTRTLDNGYSYMQSNGTNDCRIKATVQLDAELKAIGSIYYYGNPVVVNLFNETGTGKLIKAD